MGSSEELPLVSTIGQAVSRISRWCRGVYGSITPSWRLPGARPAAADQQRLGRLVHLTELAGHGEAGHHDRERLILPVLAIPQRRGCALVARIHRQVIAAQALDGEYLALPQQRGRRRERLAGQRRARRVLQPQPGTAGRAARRLRVEPPVRRVVVLRGAL